MKLLKLYNDLLDKYTEQIVKLKKLRSEYSNEHNVSWVPFTVLNSRMFMFDEHLKNIHHSGFCYEEKNLIMPYLVNFMATYESASDKENAEFIKLKPKNNYQESIDNIIKKASPFLQFHKSLLNDLEDLKYSYTIPIAPKQRNATRQLAKYKKDRKEYFENIEILNKCKKEVNDRIEIFKKLIQ